MAIKQVSDDVEYTYGWYRDFLAELADDLVDFRSVADGLDTGQIVCRHDVDLSLTAATRLAALEAEADVSSTYCILLCTPLYNPFERTQAERIRSIERLGHEIGLHFDTHRYWREEPGLDGLEARINRELSMLESIIDGEPTTVSFHRPPSWILDRRFAGFTSTYAPEFFGHVNYVADSSQRWREEPPRFDDDRPMQLLTHPGLWAEADGPFESRVREAVIESSLHTHRRALGEFLDEGER